MLCELVFSCEESVLFYSSSNRNVLKTTDPMGSKGIIRTRPQPHLALRLADDFSWSLKGWLTTVPYWSTGKIQVWCPFSHGMMKCPRLNLERKKNYNLSATRKCNNDASPKRESVVLTEKLRLASPSQGDAMKSLALIHSQIRPEWEESELRRNSVAPPQMLCSV